MGTVNEAECPTPPPPDADMDVNAEAQASSVEDGALSVTKDECPNCWKNLPMGVDASGEGPALFCGRD